MIEYIDDAHLYLYDGVIIPSVSQILHEKVFPHKYDGVPSSVLNAKAEYGTKVHSIIEDLENGREYQNDSVLIQESINQYLYLKEKYKLNVVEQEKIVCYKGLYAGRFDMIANIGNDLCLCDIKTTAQLDKEYLSWQLSMYELAYGKTFDKLIAIWLPKKDLGKIVEIERKDKKEIEKILEVDNEESI